MRRRALIIPAVLALAVGAAWGQSRDLALRLEQERRVALVVGNNDYRHAPKLANAANDAHDLARALTEIGFEVEEAVDVGLRELDEAVDRFIGKLRPGDVALFHFSGHGIEVGGENYLVPVDFQLKDEASVRYDAYSAAKLHDRMAGAPSRLNILMLDACRNNGFQTARSSGGGLAMMNAAEGSFIAFATGPGMTADDNRDGRNGLFTAHLLETIRQPGLTLDEVFNRVREQVFTVSGKRQLPWTSSSVIGDFFFKWRQPEPEPAPPPETQPAVSMLEVELRFWESVKDADNPALFEAYLKRFPEGHFVEIAQLRLEDLHSGGSADAETQAAEAAAEASVAEAIAEEGPAAREERVEQAAAPPVVEPRSRPAPPPAAPRLTLAALPVVSGDAGLSTRLARDAAEFAVLAEQSGKQCQVVQLSTDDGLTRLGSSGYRVRLRRTDPKRQRFTLTLHEPEDRPAPETRSSRPSLRPEVKVSVLDSSVREIEKKNVTVGEPIQFRVQDDQNWDEIVILRVDEDRVIGYLAEAAR